MARGILGCAFALLAVSASAIATEGAPEAPWAFRAPAEIELEPGASFSLGVTLTWREGHEQWESHLVNLSAFWESHDAPVDAEPSELQLHPGREEAFTLRGVTPEGGQDAALVLRGEEGRTSATYYDASRILVHFQQTREVPSASGLVWMVLLTLAFFVGRRS